MSLLVALAFTASVKIGSKRFTESYVLAEIATRIAKEEGVDATHSPGLGATAVVFRALEDGSIDAYPEYTGTLAETVVKDGKSDIASLRASLAPKGLSVSDSLGFEDTYALAVRKEVGIRRISDLQNRDFVYGLSHEFVGRNDGWPGLSAKYELHPRQLSALDHALSYEAIKGKTVDVVDVYTTDAKIARYDLTVLEDDRHFFPPYEAVIVYRTGIPGFDRVLSRMKGSIDATAMQKMNARVELDGISFADAANEHLGGSKGSARPGMLAGLAASIRDHGPRHLMLVGVSLLISAFFGLPIGVLAFTRRRLGTAVLGITGVVQTIPSLALFCFFIPLLGIGIVPALAALSLYGLLPIVNGVHAGLSSVPADLREAAVALGLTPRERLRYVELPLAARTVISGLKTSAVIAVGSATIAAFIGAGGFGEPISTGLSLNDVPIILQGAIPAAGLALLVQGLFALLERVAIPRGLR